jgi:drug/metabolite transporter (DMT)-like permease
MLIGVLIYRWGRSLLRPWTRVMGDDPAARVVGWVFILLGGAAIVAILGAAVAALAWTLPSILRRESDSVYALMLLPLAGLILSILAPVGPWLLIEGYRQSRPPKPPPASPPPR